MRPAQIRQNSKSIRFGTKQLMRAAMANKAASLPAALAGLAVTAFLVGALLPSGQKAAQSGPISSKSKVAGKSANTTVAKSVASTPTTVTTVGRRSLSFYTGDVRASMFSEPVAPAPPTPPSNLDIKPIRPVPVDPFAEWNFTGTATIGDDKIAIIENINTHDGVLLHMGDKFLGKKVTDISGSLLTLGTGSTQKSLFVSMNTSYIPLSSSASFLTIKPDQPANPQANLQALLASLTKGNSANAAPGGPSVTLPNGSVLSGNALTRYNRRLNRGWNGNTTPTGR